MKKFELVIPTEWDIFDDVLAVFQSKDSVVRYAWALHPVDELSSFEHYHIGCQLSSSWEIADLLKWFKEFEQIKNNSIEKIKSTFDNYCVYLLHKTKAAVAAGKSLPVKYGGTVNFDNILGKYQESQNIDELIGKILNHEYKEYQFYMDKELVHSCVVSHELNKVKEAFSASYKSSMLGADRNTDRRQLWIYGLAGSGKTELAKYAARQYGFDDMDIYITSSGKNPFDDYMGQPVVIVDDIDSETCSPKTALKLCDCFTQSSVAARYNNKYVSAELVIFTSTKSPGSWWKRVADESTDGNIYQLYRRLNLGSWFITSDYIVQIDLYDKSGNYKKQISRPLPSDIIEKIKKPIDDDVIDDIDIIFGVVPEWVQGSFV